MTIDIDMQVLIYDSASLIDNYTLDPREDPENPGQSFGIFTWNESSFYPAAGLKDPGLQIAYDHDSVSVIDPKYFKSGIGESDALELVSQDKSIASGSIDLTLNHGSVYLYDENIPIPSVTSIGISVQGLTLSTIDATPLTLTKIGVPVKIEGEEHFIANIISPGFIPAISQKWTHVNKFTGNVISGKTLDTSPAPLQFKNIDQSEYEYIIYNLPERSDIDEYGYKQQLTLPTLVNGLNTLTNFLIDPISGNVIFEDLTVSGTDLSDVTINKVTSNPFSRTDIFNVMINVGTPNAAGEYKINFTTGTLEVFTDNEVNFPGLVDFYTDYPAYIIFNQDVNEVVSPTTYAGLGVLVVDALNVATGEKLTTSGTIGGDVFTYALANGGITDFRLFTYDGVTAVELTEYTGSDTTPVGEFIVNRFQGTVSFNIDALAAYDVYAMYNYGPVGHLESVLATTVEYKDIQIVADLSSNNNGYIVLAQAPKSIAFITYELLSTAPIDDIDTNSYIVDVDSIFSMKVCVKSPTGKPVPGVPIEFTSEDGSIEVLFTTGNTDRNGCVFMTFKAPGVDDMLIAIPWYKFTKQSEQGPAAFASGASVVTVNSAVIPNALWDAGDPNYLLASDITTAPLKYTLEISDVINPAGGGYPVVLQYKVISVVAGTVAGTLDVTIDGTLPFKSSGYLSGTSALVGMYSKAQLFRNRLATTTTSSQQLVDSGIVVVVAENQNPTGDGTPVATFTIANVPVMPGSVVVIDDQGIPETWTDNGDGTLAFAPAASTVQGVSGTIDYATGVVALTYAGNVTLTLVDIDYTFYSDTVTLTDLRIKANFTDLVNGVFIYKTLANETLSPATISRIGMSDVLANGTSLIIEDDSATTQAITAYVNDAGEPQVTIAGHGYVDDQVVIIAGTNTTVAIVGAVEVPTYSNGDKTVTFQLEPNITQGTLTFTFNGLNWMDTGNGSVISTTASPGYSVGSINYKTGVLVLNKSTAITLALTATAVTYDYVVSYNGAWVIKSAALNTFVLENAVYNAGVTTMGTAIATTDRFITLTSTNTAFSDGSLIIDNLPRILDFTDVGDIALYGEQASFGGLYPFQYILLPTGKSSSAYFTARDPFSGKIIQSDTWTISIDLPTNNYGALVLDNNLISSGSYIL